MRLKLILFTLITPTMLYAASPTGQVKISADSVELDQATQSSTYKGHVVLQQGEMKLEADKVEVSTKDRKLDVVKATGKPAILTGRDNQNGLIDGRANKITYHAVSGDMHLQGNARLMQQNNTIESADINYNMARGTLLANGDQSSGSRVEVILSPASQ